jgi:SPP1 gp7 family putative phage head morphogenesis protein
MTTATITANPGVTPLVHVRKPWGWRDKVQSPGAAFRASKAAEREYATALRNVAREVRRIVSEAANDPAKAAQVQKALEAYSDLLTPWARTVAGKMLKRADLKSEAAFRQVAKAAGKELRAELSGGGPVATAFQARLDENVLLIKSLPTEAGERVATITTEGLASGTRADVLAQAIGETGDVTESRALLIARTESSKATTALTKARAETVGSDGYIWRTSHDGAVRPSHAAMDGKMVQWDEPPTLDGMTGHAGEFPNCRCYAEPVLPQEA